MGASPSTTVVELVERFERDRKVFLSPDYKEEQLRAAGLAVRRSTFGACTFLGPVIHEKSINACPERSRRVAGATKAPDYTFRIGGRRVFFAEAKKPAVRIAEDARRVSIIRKVVYTIHHHK
jgi:hypothetical protein